jgi:hypothetical protein
MLRYSKITARKEYQSCPQNIVDPAPNLGRSNARVRREQGPQTLAAEHSTLFVKHHQPGFTKAVSSWAGTLEYARKGPFAVSYTPAHVLYRVLFADTSFKCFDCGCLGYLLGSEDFDDDECAEHFHCPRCAHIPCAECNYHSEIQEQVAGQTKISLSVWAAVKERPGLHWICCWCGAACKAHAFLEPSASLDQVLLFFGSTCPACKQDCCGRCACFEASGPTVENANPAD